MGKLRTEITERDNSIFNLIKKFGYVREDLLARYLNLDYSIQKNKVLLSKLSSRLNRYIIKEKYIYGKQFYWSLSKSGCEINGSSRPKKIILDNLVHDDFVVELGINFLLNNKDILLNTEFEMRQSLFGKEAKECKLPDLVIDEKIAIEVELSRKDDRRILSIINTYNNSDFESIIYYTNNQSVINKFIKYLNENKKFKFKIFKDNILDSVDYTSNKSVDLQRNNAGEFESNNEFMNRLLAAGKRN